MSARFRSKTFVGRVPSSGGGPRHLEHFSVATSLGRGVVSGARVVSAHARGPRRWALRASIFGSARACSARRGGLARDAPRVSFAENLGSGVGPVGVVEATTTLPIPPSVSAPLGLLRRRWTPPRRIPARCSTPRPPPRRLRRSGLLGRRGASRASEPRGADALAREQRARPLRLRRRADGDDSRDAARALPPVLLRGAPRVRGLSRRRGTRRGRRGRGGEQVAHEGSHEDDERRVDPVPQHRRRPPGRPEDLPVRADAVLDQPALDAAPESVGRHRQGSAGAVRAVAAPRQVQAPAGPHGGGRQEALRVVPPQRQERARPAALQRPRRPATDRERRGVGVQQVVHAVHPALRVRPSAVDREPGDLRLRLQRRGSGGQLLPADG